MLNANFGYKMPMTVDFMVKMPFTEKMSICDNGLEAPAFSGCNSNHMQKY